MMKRSYSKPQIKIIAIDSPAGFLAGSGGKTDEVFVYRGSTNQAEGEKEYWTKAEESFARISLGLPEEDEGEE